MRKYCRHWGFVCLPFSCFAARKSQAERKMNHARSSIVSPIISRDSLRAVRRSKCVEEIRGIWQWQPRSVSHVVTHLSNYPVSRCKALRQPSGHDLRGMRGANRNVQRSSTLGICLFTFFMFRNKEISGEEENEPCAQFVRFSDHLRRFEACCEEE